MVEYRRKVYIDSPILSCAICPGYDVKLSKFMSGKGVILLTDRERKDTISSVLRDSKIALERAKSKLENATLEYLYVINTHCNTINEYLDDIQKLLNDDEMENKK